MNPLTYLFPDELDEALTSPTATAILPIGSVEQHGPHLLLGCDGYIAHAVAAMAATQMDAVLFPMIPFSWIGGLRPFAGTIDLRPYLTMDYMEQTALTILEMGFSQLILVNAHGGGREAVFAVARSLHKQTGKRIISSYPSNIYDCTPEIAENWRAHGITAPNDWAAYETSELMGALAYFKREDLAGAVAANNTAALAEFGEIRVDIDPPSFRCASRLGEVGHDYTHECLHVQPRRAVSQDAGAETLRLMAEKIVQSARL